MTALETLVERYLVRGDEEALEEVVRRTRPRLLRAARRIASEHDADDCVQTAYLSLMHKRGAALEAPVVPWLVTAVVRTAYRRRARHQRHDEIARQLAWARREAPSPVTAAMRAETATLLRGKVDQLPPRLRDAAVLHYLQGLSIADTALLLEITEANVRKRLERARRVLRARLVYPLLAVPWLLADAAALGGVVVKKNAVMATVLILLLAGAGLLVSHFARSPGSSERASEGRGAGGTAERAGDAPGDAGNAEVPFRLPDEPHLAGRVVGPDGRPVAGARVMARPVGRKDAVRFESAAASDEHGRFAVVLDGHARASTLHARADGFSPAVLHDLPPSSDLLITLSPAPALAGQVMDLKGRPVAGVRVRWLGFYDGIHMEKETRSGGDGGYRIDGLPAPGTYSDAAGYGLSLVTAEADGFAPLRLEIQLPKAFEGATKEQNLVLDEGITVKGKVIDAGSGANVPGARVVCWRGGRTMFGNFEYRGVHRHLAETRADAEGRFAFEGVPSQDFFSMTRTGPAAGGVQAGAVADRYAPGVAHWRPAPPGSSVEIEIRLWPAVVVTGRVVDSDRKPVANARVSFLARGVRAWSPLYHDGDLPPRSVATDAEGRFRLENVPAFGRVLVGAVIGDLVASGQVRLELREAGARDVGDIVVKPIAHAGAVVTVVDGADAPVPAARIVTVPLFGPVRHTDADGSARLRLRGDKAVRLEVRARGFQPVLTKEIVPSAAQPPEVRVVLQPALALAGEVRWADGAPADGVRVWVYNGTVPYADVRKWSRGAASIRRYGSARTDVQGRFRVSDLPAGPYHVLAQYNRYPEEPAEVVLEGAASGEERLVLTLPRDHARVPTAVVEGAVTDAATGEPVRLFKTMLLKNRRWWNIAATAPGRYRSDPLPPGPVVLKVHADGFVSFERRLEVRDATLRIDVELSRGVTVTGKVAGVEGARIQLVRDDGILTTIASMADDRTFELKNVAPGRYHPRLFKRRGRELEQFGVRGHPELVIAAGASKATLDMEAVDGGLLHVTCKSGSGEVTVRGAGGGWAAGLPARLLTRGRAWTLPPGKYDVNGKSVVVRAGEITRVEMK